jgi:hypothetical protein
MWLTQQDAFTENYDLLLRECSFSSVSMYINEEHPKWWFILFVAIGARSHTCG